MSATYNPSQQIELRITDLNGENEEFTVYKAEDIEAMLRNQKRLNSILEKSESTISEIKTRMTLSDWYSDHTDKDEVLDQLAQIINFEPVANIVVTATIDVTLSAEIPLSEFDGDFDAESFVTDNLDVSGYSQANVDDWQITDTNWEEA